MEFVLNLVLGYIVFLGTFLDLDYSEFLEILRLFVDL
jgi:hypothetical protein